MIVVIDYHSTSFNPIPPAIHYQFTLTIQSVCLSFLFTTAGTNTFQQVLTKLTTCQNTRGTLTTLPYSQLTPIPKVLFFFLQMNLYTYFNTVSKELKNKYHVIMLQLCIMLCIMTSNPNLCLTDLLDHEVLMCIMIDKVS